MKDCPDLVSMSYSQKVEFWQKVDPRTLRRLGDRLLAESLPLYCSGQDREQLAALILEKRKAQSWSRTALAKQLEVTESMLEAWENDMVKAPDSIPLIIDRLVTLEISLS